MKNSLETIELLNERSAPFPRGRAIREWKEEGKRVIGWLCNYVPEEVIHAAGILPVRILGGEKTVKADGYLYTTACSFVRGCLELALDKEYEFLDGIVAINSCDSMRRLYDVWRNYIGGDFFQILGVPFKVDEDAYEFFRGQIIKLKENLERTFRIEITEESLKESIGTYNQTRLLLQEINKLRKNDPPPITGGKFLEVVKAGLFMPKDEYNKTLKDLLNEIEEFKRDSDGKVRLMVAGSIIGDPQFFNAIEKSGGTVVVDDLCIGTRYFNSLVDVDLKPIDGLTARYLNRIPCARMFDTTSRFENLLRLIEEYKVEGVILEALKFCDPYGYEKPQFRKKLENMGIKAMELDLEYEMSGVGQILTRIQAFIEIIRREKK